MVQKDLDSQPGPHAIYHYGVPGDKYRGNLSLTMVGKAERVDAGTSSPPTRESCSFVYHCHSGKGSTLLRLANGGEETIEWNQGDTFVVPAWTERIHTADGGATSYLFAVNDLPLLSNLGMYRKE